MHDYFHFKRPVLTLVDNANGEPEQIMIVKSTTSVKFSELEKNLRIYQLPENHRKGNRFIKRFN